LINAAVNLISYRGFSGFLDNCRTPSGALTDWFFI
jgi:hypothetical protein